jgi:polyisoprenoid-binding protein YceI
MSSILDQTTALPTGTWTLDPVHSHVGFTVDYLVGTFRGSFSPVDASLSVADQGDTKLEGSAGAANVKIDEPNLLGHLLSPDFFDAERTPDISFASTSFDQADESVTIGGELTIKGQTKPVELTGTLSGPIEDAFGNERVGLHVSTVVDRTSFGLNWNMPLPNGKKALADDVSLEAELFFVRA